MPELQTRAVDFLRAVERMSVEGDKGSGCAKEGVESRSPRRQGAGCSVFSLHLLTKYFL